MSDSDAGVDAVVVPGADVGLGSWTAAGLFDPDRGDAAERAALLSWLDGLGLGPDDFAGLDYDDVVVLANVRWLRRGRRHGYDEAAAVTGLDRPLFDRVASAGGYGRGDTFSDLDIAAFQAFGAAAAMFSDHELLHFTRVLSSAMTRIADAATALFRLDVGSDIERRDLDELSIVRTNHLSELLSSGCGPGCGTGAGCGSSCAGCSGCGV